MDRTFSIPYGHVVDQTVQLLEKALDIGVPGTVIPYLPPHDDTVQEAMHVLARNGLIPKDFAIIAVGGGWETKLLKERLIAKFCDCVNTEPNRNIINNRPYN